MRFLDSHTEKISLASIRSCLTRLRNVTHLSALERLLAAFSPIERLVLYVLAFFLAISAFGLVTSLSREFSTVIPTRGGSLVEGEVGPVRFINPVLALSQADGDLTALVYSGLMRAMPDGSYVPDLAQEYSISQDGTAYTFKLRADATFQDGTPVTSEDVAYTISLAQDPAMRSPRQADWTGVQVSTPDTHTVVFTLPHAYAPFIDNATLGILPKHLWKDVSAEEFPFSTLNMHPVGSGLYRVVGNATDATGAATKYDLAPFARSVGGSALVSHITFQFYPNEDALIQAYNAGIVQSISGVSPENVRSLTRGGSTLLSVPLPRTYGIFLNQGKNPVLADAGVRAALDAAIDKQQVVTDVLHGFGTVLSGPIPPGTLADTPMMSADELPITAARTDAATTSTPTAANILNAQAILQRSGWKYDAQQNVWTKGKETLTIALATADDPELIATAREVAAAWNAAGIKANVQVYSISEFSTNILRPRSYDAILFGQVVGRTADLFAFWHSSQRTDPGLNLALYANSHADQLLSQARGNSDTKSRASEYKQFADIITKDQPAIFLYAPDFLYVVPNGLHGVSLGALSTPAERFLGVRSWYTETARVWDVFAKETGENN